MMNGRPARTSHDPRRGPFRDLRRGLGKLVASRPFMLAMSLLVAVLFWGTLVSSDGSLTRQKTFASVPLSVTGETALQSRGYIVMDDLSDLVPSVRLTVDVPQASYSRVTGTSYNPHIDVSQIVGEGENELAISCTSQLYGPVVSIEPSTVTVNVERYVTRRVPVSLEPFGDAPAGTYLSAYHPEPTILSVSGPQSLVTRVVRAVARFDASSLSPERMSDRMLLDIELQDSAGEVITSDKIRIADQTVITSTVVAETELVPMKDVPVDVSSLITGKPAEGYELTGVIAAADSLPVAAPQEVLDSILTLSTDSPLDITDATQDVTGHVRLRRTSGVVNTLPAEFAVTATIAERTLERTFRNVSVSVEGLDDGFYRASLSRERVNVTLSGKYGFINDLSSEDIWLYVDVTGLGEGTHRLPVRIALDGTPEFDCELSAAEVTVTIRAK